MPEDGEVPVETWMAELMLRASESRPRLGSVKKFPYRRPSHDSIHPIPHPDQ
jgi:hypothetical protein